MARKFVILLAVVAMAKGAVVQVSQPVIGPVAARASLLPVAAKLEEFDARPRYSFAYDVQDSITGDSKAQYETREGDVVQGSYSLIEPDGTRRIVEYSADPVNGFNALVRREPPTDAAVAEPLAVGAVPATPAVASALVPQLATSGPDAEVEVIDARQVKQQRQDQQETFDRLRAAPQQTAHARVQAAQQQQQQQQQQQPTGLNAGQVPVRAVAAALTLPATRTSNVVEQRLLAAAPLARFSLAYPSAIAAAYASPLAYSAPVSGLTYTATLP